MLETLFLEHTKNKYINWNGNISSIDNIFWPKTDPAITITHITADNPREPYAIKTFYFE